MGEERERADGPVTGPSAGGSAVRSPAPSWRQPCIGVRLGQGCSPLRGVRTWPSGTSGSRALGGRGWGSRGPCVCRVSHRCANCFSPRCAQPIPWDLWEVSVLALAVRGCWVPPPRPAPTCPQVCVAVSHGSGLTAAACPQFCYSGFSGGTGPQPGPTGEGLPLGVASVSGLCVASWSPRTDVVAEACRQGVLGVARPCPQRALCSQGPPRTVASGGCWDRGGREGKAGCVLGRRVSRACWEGVREGPDSPTSVRPRAPSSAGAGGRCRSDGGV